MHTEADENKKDTKWLLRIAIGLAVILVLGVIGLVVYAANQITSPSRRMGSCEPISIPLAGKGQLVRIDEQEKAIVVWLKESPTTLNIRHYNACTGQVMKDVRVSADQLP